MKVEITIPEEAKDRVLNVMCAKFRYQSGANYSTKEEFLKYILTSWIKDVVKSHEANVAAELARQSALESSEPIDIQ